MLEIKQPSGPDDVVSRSAFVLSVVAAKLVHDL